MCRRSTRRVFADAVSFALRRAVLSLARWPAAGDQAEQHGQRLVVAEHERRQAVSGRELVAAVAAPYGLHGHVHVQVDQVAHLPAHGAPLDDAVRRRATTGAAARRPR